MENMIEEKIEGILPSITDTHKVVPNICDLLPPQWTSKLLTPGIMFRFRINDIRRGKWRVEWGEMYTTLCSPYMVTWEMIMRSYKKEYFKHLSFTLNICGMRKSNTRFYEDMSVCRIKYKKRLKYNRPVQYECKGCGRREMWDLKFKRCCICHDNEQRYCSQICYFSKHPCAKKKDNYIIGIRMDNLYVPILVSPKEAAIKTSLPTLANGNG